MPKSPPNIVQIICHDLGRHCGCYGAGVATPNIDALAREGVLFRNYHCPAAQCSPSRGSIMTGRYPHRNGLVGLAHIGWELHETEKTLPMYLGDLGYSTHLFGIQHETSGDPRRLGYDRIEATGGKARELAGSVAGFLAARAKDHDGRPFYVNMGTNEPHRPYEQEGYDGDDPAAVQPLPWLPDRPGIREDIADLNGLVHALDEAVGHVKSALDQSGLARDTLLVFTTDHGLAMPRAKGTCYDPGTGTTLILRLPGRWEGGRAHDELLTNCDLLPTLTDLAGGPEPADIDGRSFLPLLDGGPYQPRESIFSEMTWHDKYNPMRAIRTRRYKYIRNFGDRPLVFLPLDVWNGRAGQEMRGEYYGSRRPVEELYDLEADPLERANLAADPAHAETLKALRAEVEGWMKDTGDGLVRGDWPPTEAQRVRLETSGEPN